MRPKGHKLFWEVKRKNGGEEERRHKTTQQSSIYHRYASFKLLPKVANYPVRPSLTTYVITSIFFFFFFFSGASRSAPCSLNISSRCTCRQHKWRHKFVHGTLGTSAVCRGLHFFCVCVCVCACMLFVCLFVWGWGWFQSEDKSSWTRE